MADKRISQLIERTDIANNDVLPIVASGATTTNKVTVSTLQDWMQDNLDVGVTSVGLSVPSAFTISGSPVTTSGNITISGAGTTAQYIRGDGSLADFPSSLGGGGASVSYYLNGSVSQGTIGGVAYRELSKSPILGSGTDFTINADGYIASFITDAGDPSLLEIPGGNWNFETYFQASSGGGTPSFYVELYKVSSGGTATLIATSSGSPELIAFGTNTTPYFSSLAVPTTTLALTDRLAIRYYVTHSGRTITLHTENNTLCQIITTFTTGLTALNGLTAQVQNFATGTSGTDFNISSASTTHTFNLPDASASNRGAVTTGSQVFGGVKTFANGLSLSAVGGSNQVTRIVNIGTLHEGSATLNQIGFNSANNIYFGKGLSNGGVLQWTNAAVRYYTLPDADGTLALASQIPTNPVGGTGAQGRVAYWSGSGTITSDSLFQWNDTFKRLGIGRTPTVSLDVEGSATVSNTIKVESSAGNGLRIYGSSGTNQWDMYLNGTNLRFSDNTGTGSIVFDRPLTGTSATFAGRLSATGSDFHTLAGISASAQLKLERTTTSAGVMYIGADVDGFKVFNSSFATNLLIAPTGAATFSSSVTAAGALRVSGGSTFTNGELEFTSTTSGGQLGIFSNQGTSTTLFFDHRATGNTGNFSFRNGSGGANTLMYIAGSGNVGIGTASPASRFQIEGTGTGAWLTINRTDSGTNIVDFTQSGGRLGYVGYVGSDLILNNVTASNTILHTSGLERMRITSSGNVGIGTGSTSIPVRLSGRIFAINDTSINNQPSIELLRNGVSSGEIFVNSDNMVIGSFESNIPLCFRTQNVERMRITSGGFVLVNRTSTLNNGWFEVNGDGSRSGVACNQVSTASSAQIYFSNPNGIVGSIFSSGSATSYNTSSDYRLKENIKPVENALSILNQLKPCSFNFIADADEEVMGFIAHEVQEVIPQAVTGEKDGFRIEEVEVSPAELDEEGNVITEAVIEEKEIPVYQGIDHSKLVPLLVAAIQELKTEIDSLKNQTK